MPFLVIDLAGTTLLPEEAYLIQHPYVAGIILFTRNYENPEQLRALTDAIRDIRDDLFVSVDQEGGRVQRFRGAEFTEIAPMATFGKHYKNNPKEAKQQLEKTMTVMAYELKHVGVTVNFAPVLDTDYHQSKVIGDRSLSDSPSTVAELGSVIIDALHAQSLLAVGKHFPNHGGVIQDSHQALPTDSRDFDTVWANDLLPFRTLAEKLDAIMPAHIIYSAIDPQHPVGFSAYWLKHILRERLSFGGVIITDDISMGGAAAIGDYPTRVQNALEAGCDLIIVANNPTAVQALLNKSFDQPLDAQQRVKAFQAKAKNALLPQAWML